jgi:hypothetical protein
LTVGLENTVCSPFLPGWQEVDVSWWRIDEQTAGQVVASAAASAGRYVTAQGDVAESAGVLAAALSNSGIVAAAVEGWMSGCGVPGLREVRELTGTVIGCAGDALGVYRDGDFVMAGNARAVASFAEVPAWLPGSSGESPYDPVRFGRR